MKITPSAASQVLFRVVMRHAYLYAGAPGALAAQPTPATAERLRRLGWLCKALPDGFVVIGTAPGPPTTPDPDGRANLLPLLFCLIPQAPLFFAHTSLAPEPGRLYLYRLEAVVARAGQVVAGPALGQRPLVATQAVAASVARTGQLQGPLSAGTSWPVTQAVPAQATSVVLDVSGWGSGAYRWQLDGEEVSFYADDYLMATQARAVLEIDATVLQAPLGTVYTLALALRPSAQPQPSPSGSRGKLSTRG